MKDFDYSSRTPFAVLACATLACPATVLSSPIMKRKRPRWHLVSQDFYVEFSPANGIHPKWKLPEDILSWKVIQNDAHQQIWDELTPLLRHHGYRLWRMMIGA